MKSCSSWRRSGRVAISPRISREDRAKEGRGRGTLEQERELGEVRRFYDTTSGNFNAFLARAQARL